MEHSKINNPLYQEGLPLLLLRQRLRLLRLRQGPLRPLR